MQYAINNLEMLGFALAGIALFIIICVPIMNGQDKVLREARRLEAERKARVEQHEAEWRAAHPELVAKGVPPPPTPESMTQIGVHGFGGFYRP